MRDYAREALNRVRGDLNISDGTPLSVFLVEPLASFLPSLDEKIDDRFELNIDDRATLLLLDRSEGTNSEFNVRFYFSAPIELNYGAADMDLPDVNGYTFSNKHGVSVPAADMALYTEESYYYTDITVSGETSFTSDNTIEWEGAPPEFSYLSVTSITTSGNLAETDDTLERRMENEITLRNVVTNPGIEGWFYNNYPGTVRESTSIGFGHEKMLRDINTTLSTHLGGYIDVYVKEDMPPDTTLVADILPLTDREWTKSVRVAFTDTGEQSSLYYKNLLSTPVPTVDSSVRVQSFTALVDYTIDITNGVIANIPGGSLLVDPESIPWEAADWTVSGRTITLGTSYASGDLYADMFVRLTNDYTTTGIDNAELYLVISADDTTNSFVVDRDPIVPATGGNDRIWRYEPVDVAFTYNPMGIELIDFSNPLIWINSVTQLDTLTLEPLDPLELITPLEGWSGGPYGSGPYGVGGTEGWVLIVDDSNYRYSPEETGVLEFIGNFLGDKVSVSYKHSPNIDTFQTAIESQRAQGSSVLLKAYIPVGVTLSADVTGGSGIDEIVGIDEYIWDLSNRMELSDIINEIYNLGATFVDLGDISDNAVFQKWNTDGTFTTLVADSQGVLDINDSTSRFLPVSLEFIVS